MGQKFWINKAWLDKVGLGIPTTPEELKTALLAFKDGDPNGNGEADEIGITVTATTTLGDLDLFLMNPFQFSPGDPWMYVGPEGQVVASYTQDGWKEGVKYMRDLYANGLIDPESFTQTEDEMVAKSKNPDTSISTRRISRNTSRFRNSPGRQDCNRPTAATGSAVSAA
jgi:putative aldouronate transport system substrate-binding protein